MDNIIAYPTIASVKASDTPETDLLDCYRIALDFGWDAAESAFQHLATTPVQQNLGNKKALGSGG